MLLECILFACFLWFLRLKACKFFALFSILNNGNNSGGKWRNKISIASYRNEKSGDKVFLKPCPLCFGLRSVATHKQVLCVEVANKTIVLLKAPVGNFWTRGKTY